MVPSLGQHYLVDLHDCSPVALNDQAHLRSAMLEAATRLGATILGDQFHRFSPHGVSGVVVIAESHLTIHTWPEHAYAAVDLFTCGQDLRPMEGISYLVAALACGRKEVTVVARGRMMEPPDSRFPRTSV